ncbi:hypothetical protein HDU99_004137, partial [Rhizoclosmatium hyalinum]
MKGGAPTRKDKTTKLPASIEALIADSASPSTGADGSRLTHKQQKELDKRFKVKYSKKALFGRKEERKKKRLEKKQHRVEAIQKRAQINKEKAALK